MASYRIFIDKRNKKGDYGKLSMQIYQNGKSTTISLGISIKDDELEGEKIVKNKFAREYNAILRNRISAINSVVAKVPIKSRSVTISDVKRMFLEQIGEEQVQKDRFIDIMESYTKFLKPTSKRNYYTMYHALLRFDSRIERKRIGDIDRKTCESFRNYLMRNYKNNSASNIYGFFFVIIKEACKNEIIPKLPCEYNKIKIQETRKRSLSLEQIRILYNADIRVTSTRENCICRDLFMLSFFLCGLNPIDILNARMENVYDGRLEVRRSKTGKLLSIYIPDEAWEIIRRYPSEKGNLIGLMDNHTTYTYVTDNANKTLKKIDNYITDKGLKGKLPTDISLYWARHSFATLALKHLNASNYIIGHALGHRWTFSSITDVYIDFDMEKVDEIQKKLIELIKNEK